MQLARYKDFESFLDGCLPEERAVVLWIHGLVENHFPELKQRFAYGVPYYWGFRRIFFLYPASFPYSGVESGVNMGLVRGNQLSNEQGLLDMGDRKEVGYINLQKPYGIQEELLLEMLHEAALVDAELRK